MTGLRGVLSRDLAGYVGAAYRPDWVDPPGSVLDQAAIYCILQTPEGEHVSYRAVMSGLLEWGFTFYQVLWQAAECDCPRCFPTEEILQGWLLGVPPSKESAEGIERVMGMWLQSL